MADTCTDCRFYAGGFCHRDPPQLVTTTYYQSNTQYAPNGSSVMHYEPVNESTISLRPCVSSTDVACASFITRHTTAALRSPVRTLIIEQPHGIDQ